MSRDKFKLAEFSKSHESRGTEITTKFDYISSAFQQTPSDVSDKQNPHE